MGKKSSKAPAPPDPAKVAAAQTTQNKDSAAYNAAINRGNTTTPGGSQTYAYRGTDPATGAPIYDQNISLSPESQQVLNTANAQIPGLAQTYGQPMDTSGVPNLQGQVDMSNLPQLYGSDDLLGARQQTQDALYQRQASYLDPQYQDLDRQLTTQLANQGVVEGSEAYNNARSQFGRERGFDYDQARNAAITGGGQEMQTLAGIAQGNRGQLYGEQLSNAGFQNNARTQGLNEAYTARAQPLNEYNALKDSAMSTLPQFQNAPDVSTNPADITNPTYNSYQGQLDAYNAKQAGDNSLLSGLFSLGGALGGAAIAGPVGGAAGAKIGKKVAGG